MEERLTALWEQFSDELEKFICRQTGNNAACDDLLQEVFLKMYINISKITAADNIRAYLYRMTTNVIMDHHRRHRKDVQVSAVREEEPADEDVHQQEEYKLMDCLRPMIDNLPEIYRQALTLTDLEGYSQKQYAEIAGISVSGAKSRVQRAREKLKEVVLQCCAYEFDKYGNILSCCGTDLPSENFC